MKNILETIIAHKHKEVALRKEKQSIAQLAASTEGLPPVRSIKQSVCTKVPGLIAEFKRRSPSKGLINGKAHPEDTTAAYQQAGAAAVSILTDEDFFGGSDADLRAARPRLAIPVLRKEFIVDEYQLYEARAMGADAVLLIAAALEPQTCKQLANKAINIGLEVVLEVHNLPELEHCFSDSISIVGVNNRNLKTFEVDIAHSISLLRHIPAQVTRISESGLDNINTVIELYEAGFQGFLIGENFMKTANPGAACLHFMEQLQTELKSRMPHS